MDYLQLLKNGYGHQLKNAPCPSQSKLEFLADHIFNFTTYDSDMSELFAQKAIEVCAAINAHTTSDFIKDADNYKWYLVMCNMPFFAERLDWGTSIRGAWWCTYPGNQIEFQSGRAFLDPNQIIETIEFTTDEWQLFIADLVRFSNGE